MPDRGEKYLRDDGRWVSRQALQNYNNERLINSRGLPVIYPCTYCAPRHYTCIRWVDPESPSAKCSRCVRHEVRCSLENTPAPEPRPGMRPMETTRQQEQETSEHQAQIESLPLPVPEVHSSDSAGTRRSTRTRGPPERLANENPTPERRSVTDGRTSEIELINRQSLELERRLRALEQGTSSAGSASDDGLRMRIAALEANINKVTQEMAALQQEYEELSVRMDSLEWE